jgi:hypothetical protein
MERLTGAILHDEKRIRQRSRAMFARRAGVGAISAPMGSGLVSLLLFAAAQPAPAAGEAAARVVVVPLSELDPQRVDALYAGLEAAGVRTVARAARAGVDLEAEASGFRHARAQEPREALLRAKAAMRSLALEEVDAALAEGLQLALRTERPLDHKDLLADLLLLRAEVALARTRAEDAGRDLALLSRVDPSLEALHPGLHPPALVEAYATARQAAASAEPGLLVVLPDTSLDDARVLVDGAEVELTGGRAGRSVAAGPHLVTVTARERISSSQIVQVDPTAPVLLEVFLPLPGADDARRDALASVRADKHDARALAALCELTGASAALLVAEDLAVWSPSTSVVALAAPANDDALAIGRATAQALRPAPAPAPSPTPPGPTPGPREVDTPEEGGGSLGTIALVIGGSIGAVVAVSAAVAVTAFLLSQQPAPPNAPRPIVGDGFSPQG